MRAIIANAAPTWGVDEAAPTWDVDQAAPTRGVDEAAPAQGVDAPTRRIAEAREEILAAKPGSPPAESP